MNFINIKTDEEIKLLADLACKIWHEYWPVLLSDAQIDYMVNKFQSYRAIKNQINSEGYIYNIIEENSEVCGYFGIHPEKEKLFLSKLYVKKEFRHMGIGANAFAKICEIAKELNKKSIYLTVNKHNTNTISAYKKWGFKTINSVVTDIGQGFVMDDYIMEFSL